jgi:hypothetical protein
MCVVQIIKLTYVCSADNQIFHYEYVSLWLSLHFTCYRFIRVPHVSLLMKHASKSLSIVAKLQTLLLRFVVRFPGVHFFTFCWLCNLVYLSQYLTNLMHKICFTVSFISRLYMFRAHVLIIRRSKYAISTKYDFDILLTVHLSVFIAVLNELDAQNLFHSNFYCIRLHVSSTCAHHQEVKICITQHLVSSHL